MVMNGWSYQLTRHSWPDGRVEWGVESVLAPALQTIAYGAGPAG